MQAQAASLSALADWHPAMLVAAALVAFATAFSLVWLLRGQRAGFLRILDHPNERSLHAAPVPRTGGLGLLTGVAAGLLLAVPWLGVGVGALWLVLGTLAIAVVSLLDDRHHVPARYRLAVHALAAGLAYVGGVAWVAPGLPGLEAATWPLWLGAPLTLLFIVWMTNLYNFMDGMDGLAGGMAVFGFGALALLGFAAGVPGYGLVALVIAAAAAGFLLHNLPRAGIFLGDVGSAVLGFWAAALVLWGAQVEVFPLWVGWLVFSPFLVDATWTLTRRALRGAPVWQAHREHHYQRLVLAGWTTRRVLFWTYVLMAAAAASAVAAVRLPAADQWLLLCGWAGLYGLVHLRVRLAEGAAADAVAER